MRFLRETRISLRARKLYFILREKEKKSPFTREINNGPNLRINFPEIPSLSMPRDSEVDADRQRNETYNVDVALEAYFRCVYTETGEEDPFIRYRDSWIRAVRRVLKEDDGGVYCAKISDELQRQERISAELVRKNKGQIFVNFRGRVFKSICDQSENRRVKK